MKRFLVSLLAILYLAAGAGFTLRAHYCMGKMVGTSLEHPAHHSDTHRCDRCGMVKKSNDDNGCCKDKVKEFKSSPDQVAAKAIAFSAPLFIAPSDLEFPVYSRVLSFSAAAIPTAPAHGPPLPSGVPRYLRVRCIRI